MNEYQDGKLAGQVAKELGIVVGEIGCPHCGVTVSGYIQEHCGFCEKKFFDPVKVTEQEYTLFTIVED
jgi:hypothetical protein